MPDYRTTVQLNGEPPRKTDTIRVELPLGGTRILFTNENTLPAPTATPLPTATPMPAVTSGPRVEPNEPETESSPAAVEPAAQGTAGPPDTGDLVWNTCWLTALGAAALGAVFIRRLRFCRRRR